MLLHSFTLFGLGIREFKEIAMLVFFAIFLGILLRLIFTKSERYRKQAEMPLDDERPVEPRHPTEAGGGRQGNANHG